MKNGSPAFQFYPADWLSDERVISMSMAGEGVYVHLLCYCWREGSIPADRSAIVVLCKGYNGPGIDEALTCFVPSRKCGRLINRRVESERRKQENFRKLKQIAGLDGARKRWHTHSTPIPSAIAKNSSSSSSSSSSSNKNHKNDSIKVEKFDPLFEEFWKGYPKKVGKEVAREKFMILARAEKIPELIKATNGYMDYLKSQKVHKNFDQEPMNPATFLMKERWMDYVDFKYEPPM